METVRKFRQGQDWLYLYGIVECGMPIPLEFEASTISVIRFRNIACATTIVSAEEYSGKPASGTAEQLAWVAPRAIKHHRILMEIMAHTTVAPFKFGTLCASHETVGAVLETHHLELEALLAQLRGKEEWGVSIYVDRAAVLDHLGKTEQRLMDVDSLIGQKRGGEAYLLRKKKAKLEDALLDGALASMREDCFQRLQRVSHLVQETECAKPTDSIVQVLGATVLASKAESGMLAQTASEIEADFDGYSASAGLSGPWPPYSAAGQLGHQLFHSNGIA